MGKLPITILLIIAIFLPLSVIAQSLENLGGNTNQEDLKKSIEAKTKELKEIHQQIEETHNNLTQTSKKKQNLTQEIKNKDYQIRQLDLSIKSNLITIEKTSLEIESLNFDIEATQNNIFEKNKVVEQILRNLQIKDGEGIVVALLKNQSLAESLDEIHQLNEAYQALAAEITNLQTLKSTLNDQLNEVSGKKNKIEKEYHSSAARKSIAEEQRQERGQLLALAKTQEKTYEQQIEELAARQAKIAEEIEDLEAILRQQINTDLLPEERPGVLAWPITNGLLYLTQNYGATAFAKNGYKGHWHNGVDIGRPIGAPVLSASDGVVVSSGDQDNYCRRGAYGKYAVVRHSNNLITLYAHLSKINVAPGDKVERGGLIGYVGSTGYSTGPHLHFTVYDANTFQMRPSNSCGPMPSGGDIDPRKYL